MCWVLLESHNMWHSMVIKWHFTTMLRMHCLTWWWNLVYFFIENNKPFWIILAYVYVHQCPFFYHCTDNNQTDNGKWQRLHRSYFFIDLQMYRLWKTHFWSWISTVTNGRHFFYNIYCTASEQGCFCIWVDF